MLPKLASPAIIAKKDHPLVLQSQITNVTQKTVIGQTQQIYNQATVPSNQGVMVARMVPEIRNMAPLFTAPATPAKDETIVEITIGRLEIRGIASAPASPAKSPRRQPEPSLKEYLNRNTGGRS